MGKKKRKDTKQLPSQKKKASLEKSLKGRIIQLLESHQGQGFSVKLIARKLGLKQKAQLKDLTFELYELVDADQVQQLSNGDYKSSRVAQTITGTVDHVNPRFAYIVLADGEEDIYVKTLNLRSAVDGDTVELELLPYRSGQRAEGRVVKVLKRNRVRFVGRVELSKSYAFVIPDFRKIYQDFFVYPDKLNGAKHNDKVIVEIAEWAEADKSPEARVVEVLGKAGENEAEIHSIMAEFGLPLRFEQKVLAESETIDEGITPAEIKKRQDFRKVLTFTIDPEDAKDFDDAISFEKLKDGLYRIGVHIADVTHYVKPGSILEAEAFDRATSVYLVDRTIPMLPERLSNQLCSLRPNEDKLCFAAVFEIDDQANVLQEWFGRTIIHSDHRFAYEDAQEVIESGKGKFAAELILLNKLAKDLRKQRFAKGAVNFETTEVKFKLDSSGKPLAVIPKVRKDAHKLIEEFMLLANKQVATFIYNMKKGKDKNTFVYRIHDYPDQDRVQDFALFAKKFGHKLNIEEASISRSLNKLMDEIEGKPEQNVLQQLAVRAMAKAKYSTEEKGHFGLAFKHYSHFTSPIRRYPDMMVHRLLQHYLDNGKSADKKDFETKCVHASEREKRAADAERASIKYKQVEFMTYAEQKAYEGIISGVTDFGIFVEIMETKCEGMIRLVDIKDDHYIFDEKNYRVIGRRRKKMYTLGDKVTVKVKKTDIDRRLIDLVFANQ